MFILFLTVNDFRRVSLEMMDGRREKLLKENHDNLVGRIEFLPVVWYGAVHDDLPTGVDRCISIKYDALNKVVLEGMNFKGNEGGKQETRRNSYHPGPTPNTPSPISTKGI